VGNVLEGDGNAAGSVIALSLIDSLVGSAWSSVIYYDANGDGQLDGNDPVVTSLTEGGLAGIGPGANIRLFVKVFAPLGAPDGATNITTITATTTGVISGVAAPVAVSNEDVTTVVRGDLKVVKLQALGDGAGNPVGTFGQAVLSAPPGGEIVYRITVSNIGSTNATDIVLFDTTPSHTTYNKVGGSVATVTGGSVGTVDIEPVNGVAGPFEFNVGTLAPTATATIQFGVKINGL
jgi:uncharacterized repeat protein (TIGR01451 family)